MIKRYILALLPSERQKAAYIQVAQTVFSTICDGYLLTEGKSLPHITLGSFQCDDKKLSEICKHVEQWQSCCCPIRVMGLLLKQGKVPPHHYSVSLSIARDPAILHLHHLTVNILNSFTIDALNPIQDLYFPHLTLAGIRFAPSEIVSLSTTIDDLIAMKADPFHLALGKGDEIGQYLETLCEFKGIQ